MAGCFAWAATLVLGSLPGVAAGSASPYSLRAASTGLFTVGVGINDRIPERTRDWPLLMEQFTAVTPENCLKPNPVQVTEGRFNFGLADAFVSFAVSKLDPFRDGCPPEVLERQAEQYAQLFRLLRKHADVVARVSFWNLHDGQSWLNYFPWRRVNHPLLFDREGKPKPAFGAVVKALSR